MPSGSWRREHFAAQIAAQTIQLIHGGRQRGLSHDAHQRLGFFLRIDFAFFAARARIARVQAGMRNRDFLRAGVGRSAVAPVTLFTQAPASLLGAGVSGCSKTALVFSVVRGCGSIPASACSALLSFSLSDSLNGACVPRSMIWSSSSRFTSIRGRFIR